MRALLPASENCDVNHILQSFALQDKTGYLIKFQCSVLGVDPRDHSQGVDEGGRSTMKARPAILRALLLPFRSVSMVRWWCRAGT